MRILLCWVSDKSTGIRRCDAVLSTADTVQAVIEAYIIDEGGGDEDDEEGSEESVFGDDEEGVTGGPRGSAAARARLNLNAALQSL